MILAGYMRKGEKMKFQNKTFSISAGKQYFISTVLLFAFIIFLYYLQNYIGYQTVSLILLLVIFLMPLFNFDRGPIILAAVISALAWDYYFIPPHFTMHIAKTEDVVMLFMFFIVALTNGILTSQLKEQKNSMREKEWQSNALYLLIKDLSDVKNVNEICTVSVNQILKTFGYESVIYFPSNHTKLKREPHPASNFIPDEMEWLAAESAFMEGKETGTLTSTIQGADAMYIPVKEKDAVLCIIGVKINYDLDKDTGRINFLRGFINEIKPFLKNHIYYSIP
jgi:two-component system sensor histidine kinase KdpD